MAKTKVIIEKGLIKDIERYTLEVRKAVAHKVEDEMEKAHVEAMTRFYRDYTPVRYKRHYYNFNSNVYRRYYKNPHNKIIWGGIEISNEYLDRIYRGQLAGQGVVDSTDIVFDLVYLQGMHGNFPRKDTGVVPQSEPPIQILYKKRDDIVKNIQSFSRDCFGKAKGGAYNYISPF
jgi:hypothetical protein